MKRIPTLNPYTAKDFFKCSSGPIFGGAPYQPPSFKLIEGRDLGFRTGGFRVALPAVDDININPALRIIRNLRSFP